MEGLHGVDASVEGGSHELIYLAGTRRATIFQQVIRYYVLLLFSLRTYNSGLQLDKGVDQRLN